MLRGQSAQDPQRENFQPLTKEEEPLNDKSGMKSVVPTNQDILYL